MGTTGGPTSGASSRPSSSRTSSLQPPNGDSLSQVEDGVGSRSGSPDGYLLPNAVYPHRAWRSLDPRTSSTQSLAPSLAPKEQRRTLLVIYIHGFMGNDSSFRSFPAHVHQFLKEALAETHVIHTKIYPRYKTYKSIQVARDNFSLWLEPHKSPATDVVLVGHSMGGLLAAEVALQPRPHGVPGSSPFRHRILGTISVDAPLLGLHPGIVVSGIASLFRPTPSPPVPDTSSSITPASQPSLPLLSPDPSIYSEITPPSGASSPAPTQPSSSSSVSQFQAPSPQPPDPYFNPTFFNDISFVDRGWFRNIAHFANKHKQENLVEAAANHVMSHLEFGGCLADYPGMVARYNKLRALEDVDDLTPRGNGERAVRVRFVNYYTVSTGPLKKDKEKKAISELQDVALLKPPPPLNETGRIIPERGSLDLPLSPPTPAFTSGTGTPRISIEDHSDSGRPTALQFIEPRPEPDELVLDDPTPTTQVNSQPTTPILIPKDNNSSIDSENHNVASNLVPVEGDQDEPKLPPIPEIPPPPAPLDLSTYTSKEERKAAEKESKLLQKNHDHAVKKHAKVLKEREKILEKHRHKLQKDAEKQAKREEKQRLAEEREAIQAEKRRAGIEENENRVEREEKKKEKDKDKDKSIKLRKFCMLPGKVPGVIGCSVSVSGSGSGKEKEDPTWVKVYMEGVDEVGAHCGLFFPGPHYEKLVGDVGSRIVSWVGEDCTRRVIVEEGHS